MLSMMRFSLLLMGGIGLGVAANPSAPETASFVAKCEAFKSTIEVDNAVVHSVTHVAAGTNISMADVPDVCSLLNDDKSITVDLCRVTLNVTTSCKSQVFIELWLPSNYGENGKRFLSTGNGGLGGCIQYGDLRYAAQYGFATVGTNNGHFGDTGVYFYHNAEVLKDFAYRALHTGVVVGKSLTKQFYKEGYNKSYYMGCSTGGREGWKSVQKFPEDFDGVVAGAPAFNFVNLINWGARFLPTTGSAGQDTFVTTEQWATIHQEIIRQCDGLDGAGDGIIEDPDSCHPVFETLLCNSTANTNSSLCLTKTQLSTVNTIFSPLYSNAGSFLYPRMQPGSELQAAYIYYNGRPFQYAQDWFRYVVYGNTDWEPATWTLDDAAAADAQDPYSISTFQGDLSQFQNRGGKVLHYHGLEDPIITSESSNVYYKHVAGTMGLSPSDLDDFYRFFRISGMGHCAPGDGASFIGQGEATFAGNDPQDNVLLAMVRWVEEGVAPEHVRGTKFNGTDVEYRRKHCKYPKRNKYVGPGSWADEDAWMCV